MYNFLVLKDVQNSLTVDLITHTGGSRRVGRVMGSVTLCLCLRASVGVLKEKRLELSTPNLVHICTDPEVKESKVKVTWL